MPRRKEPHIPDAVLDQLLAGADPRTALEPNGLLDDLKKALAERVLNAEMDHHLAGEERRRTKVIPHAFGERAVLKLMYAALIRAAERWRGIRISEFEQRQLRAIREELDKDFAARNAPAATAPQSHLSSNQRT